MSGGTLSHALTFSSTSGYYLGYETTVSSINTDTTYTYPYSVGFLMAYTIDATSCVKGTYTLTTSAVFFSTYTLISYTPDPTSTTW
jgi:hypothetical protein